MAVLGMNQGTQNFINFTLDGTVYTQVVDIRSGTINAGTISALPNLPGGTLGEVTNLAGGTVTRLLQGSVTVTAGTVVNNGGTVGEVTNLVGGTLTRLAQGSINVTAGTVTAGSIVVTNGTIGAGSIVVTNGTISHGTIDNGTVQINPKPTIVTNSFGTTTTGTIGTLVAAPSAGSAIFITSLDISVNSGTAEVLVSYGLVTTGNQVVSRGNYGALGGIAKTYDPPNSGSATGTALTYNILSGSGTISYNVAYFVAIP